MKRTPIDYLIFAGMCVLCLMASGCVFTRYTDKDGRNLTRLSVFGNQSVGKIDLKNGTMEGYQSEQAEVAGAIAGQVASGVAKALVKP